MGHFLSRCLLKTRNDEKGKKKGKQTSVVASSTEMYDLARGLQEEDFAMISHFSQGTIREDG